VRREDMDPTQMQALVEQNRQHLESLEERLGSWSAIVNQEIEVEQGRMVNVAEWRDSVEARLSSMPGLQDWKQSVEKRIHDILTKSVASTGDHQNVAKQVEETLAELRIHKKEIGSVQGDIRRLNNLVDRMQTSQGQSSHQVNGRLTQLEQTVNESTTSHGTTSRPRSRCEEDRTMNLSSLIKWTKKLTEFKYTEIRRFKHEFETYCAMIDLPTHGRKMLLVHSLDGAVADFVSALPQSDSWEDILEKLISRVRPAPMTIFWKLLGQKQKSSESVSSFIDRIRMHSIDLPSNYNDRLKDILIEGLNSQWKRTGRSLCIQDETTSFDDLCRQLIELEGPDIDDKMDLDAIRLAHEYSTPDDEGEDVNAVITNGNRVDFRQINSIPSFLDALKVLSTKRGIRPQIERIVKDSQMGSFNQGYNNQQQRAYQKPYNRRNGRRINLVEEAYNEDEAEIFEDHINAPLESDSTSQPHRVNNIQETTPYRINAVCNNDPLMYIQAKINKRSIQALLDTGAAISIIPLHKARKLGLAINKSDVTTLAAYDGARSQTVGTANVSVALGDQKFNHKFCITPSMGSRLIFGNDLLKKQGCALDLQDHSLILRNKQIVPCHAIRLDKESSTKMKVMKVHPHAQLPRSRSCHAAGYDLTSCETINIHPGSRKLVSTGLKITLPQKSYGRISNLPQNFDHDVSTYGSIIDPTYSGIVKVLLVNNGHGPLPIILGQKIGQLIIEHFHKPDIVEVDNLETTSDETTEPLVQAKVEDVVESCTLYLEKKAKFPPFKKGDYIHVPMNRNIWMKPQEKITFHLPIKPSEDVHLIPKIHPNLTIQTGLQTMNRYLTLDVTNTGATMFHITDRMVLSAFKCSINQAFYIEQNGIQKSIENASFLLPRPTHHN